MEETLKKTTFTKTEKNPMAKIHVLPVNRDKAPKRTAPKVAESDSVDFSSLAKRLETRIGQIESDVKKSLELIEDDLNAAIKKSKVKKQEKAVREEIKGLAQTLENRFQKTLSSLAQNSFASFKDNDALEVVKKLTSQLVKVLSLDFYKNVIGNLGSVENAEEIDPFGMDRHLLERIKPVFDFLYYRYWRVTTTGIQNIPDDGKALIVANHSGTVPYDGAMIKSAIMNEHPKRKDARFLVEDFAYHMPIMGTFMYRIGGVRACPENAERLLDAGHLVVVFPEGVKGIGKYYDQRYKLQRFGRGGFIKLCMKTKSPLVPVGVIGAEEIHPIIFKSNVLAKTIGLPYLPITPTFPLMGLLGMIPFPSKWSIHFGEPIHFDDYPEEAMEDDLLINKLSEKVRARIQNIICDLLKTRNSVWLG